MSFSVSPGKDATKKRKISQPESVKEFWRAQMASISKGEVNLSKHELPLARIKKIMKADEDVRMISAETPIVFSKACELFVLDLTKRAWDITLQRRRKTLLRQDVVDAVDSTPMYDFLVDVIQRDPDPDQIPPEDAEYRAFQAATASAARSAAGSSAAPAASGSAAAEPGAGASSSASHVHASNGTKRPTYEAYQHGSLPDSVPQELREQELAEDSKRERAEQDLERQRQLAQREQDRVLPAGFTPAMPPQQTILRESMKEQMQAASELLAVAKEQDTED